MLLRTAAALLAAAALTALAPSSAGAQTAPLVSQLNSKCIDVPGGNTASGTRLVMWDCHGGSNQQFTRTGAGDLRIAGKCVDASGGRGWNGDHIVLWDCNGGANQRWTRQGDGTLRGINGRCIDIEGGSRDNGARLVLWDCHQGPNQKWSFGAASSVATPAPPAPPAQPAGPVKAVYVVDGTGAKARHQNVMWHFYQRFQPTRADLKYYYEGVNFTFTAADVQSIYDRVYRQICSDVRPASQGGKGVTEVYIAGYSRGAIISVGLANDTRSKCGADVRFLGLLDPVNTSIWHWSTTVNPGIPASISLEKPSNVGATVLTTKYIDGIRRVQHPNRGGFAEVGAISHEKMACPMTGGDEGARWNETQLVNTAQSAGASFAARRPDTSTC